MPQCQETRVEDSEVRVRETSRNRAPPPIQFRSEFWAGRPRREIKRRVALDVRKAAKRGAATRKVREYGVWIGGRPVFRIREISSNPVIDRVRPLEASLVIWGAGRMAGRPGLTQPGH